jgi:hypothetical protein
MITRKLNELHINKVLETINDGTLETLSIDTNRKGVHMISYDKIEEDVISYEKSPRTVELIKVLREIRKQVCENSFKKIKLDYVRKEDKLIYQLELKGQKV